jgi:hypothetical protein
MGYTTTFRGRFDLDRPLQAEHAAYLTAFSETRRMKRNPLVAATIPDLTRDAVGLPVGDDGCYFVGGLGFMGQGDDPSVIDHNLPPGETLDSTTWKRTKEDWAQPGLWCQWIPSEDLRGIEWNRGEKFYDYVAWLRYLIEHFLKRWGYQLNGAVTWQGEEHGDHGTITVTNNEVTTTGSNRGRG